LQHGVSTIPKSLNLARIKENFDVFDFEISMGYAFDGWI
jgi:methylglyoxal/glyoxal reductase